MVREGVEEGVYTRYGKTALNADGQFENKILSQFDIIFKVLLLAFASPPGRSL